MNSKILLGVIMLLCFACRADTRDWGFDKDTVYGWKAGGDSVRIINNVADTLEIDSITLEVIRPNISMMQAKFSAQSRSFFVATDFPETNGLLLVHGQALLLSAFELDLSLGAPTAGVMAKAVSMAADSSLMAGDTVVGRLKFKSAVLGDDSLVIVAISSGYHSSGLLPYRPQVDRPYGKKTKFDILGRIYRKVFLMPILLP